MEAYNTLHKYKTHFYEKFLFYFFFGCLASAKLKNGGHAEKAPTCVFPCSASPVQ